MNGLIIPPELAVEDTEKLIFQRVDREIKLDITKSATRRKRLMNDNSPLTDEERLAYENEYHKDKQKGVAYEAELDRLYPPIVK